ncbi:retrovirus-related pol polyprotein from transposon TNT 1-94 [Tanacetum coccineum]
MDLLIHHFPSPKSSHDDGSKPSSDDEKKVDEDPRKDSKCNDQEKKDNVNSTNNVNSASTNEVNVVGAKTSIKLLDDPNMPALKVITYLTYRDDEMMGVEIQSLDQVIRDLQLAAQTRNMLKNLKEHGFVSTIQQRTNHKDLQNYLFACFLSHEEPKKIEEEVYVCQPPGFEDPDFPDRVCKVEKVLYGLHQAPRAWYETLSTYLLDNEFQRGKIDKTLFIKRITSTAVERGWLFISQDKYVGEILKKFGFTEVKTASTPMETQKPLLKDEDGEEVDVHIYRYLKGQPTLGLWYLKDYPFDLVAYTDSDYVGASLDRKSTKKQKPRKPKRNDTRIPQSSGPTEYVADKVIYKELDDSLERAATTASSGGPGRQETIGDTIAQTRFENVSKHSNDPLLARGNTLRSGEDSLKLNELMELCTNLQTRVLDLEKTKTTQAEDIISLKRRVKKLEQKKRSRTHGLKRLYKGGFTTRVESSGDEESLGEDASKQGRINAIDVDEDITLVNDQDDADMFDVNTLTSDEVLAEQEVATKDVNMTVDEVTTKVSAATTTTTAIISTPKKGIVITKLGTSTTTTTTISSQPLQAKAKVDADYQLAQRLQAKEQEQFTTEQKATLFKEILEQRRKHFAAKRV